MLVVDALFSYCTTLFTSYNAQCRQFIKNESFWGQVANEGLILKLKVVFYRFLICRRILTKTDFIAYVIYMLFKLIGIYFPAC